MSEEDIKMAEVLKKISAFKEQADNRLPVEEKVTQPEQDEYLENLGKALSFAERVNVSDLVGLEKSDIGLVPRGRALKKGEPLRKGAFVHFTKYNYRNLVCYYADDTHLQYLIESLIMKLEENIYSHYPEGQLDIFRIPVDEAEKPKDEIGDFDTNLCKDFYNIFMEADPKDSKCSHYSHGKTLLANLRARIISFCLEGKKNINFVPFTEWLGKVREPGVFSRYPKYKENIRVFFSLINRHFFEICFMNSYYAMQSEEDLKLTADQVNSTYGFKVHSVTVLTEVLAPQEKGWLSGWLNSNEANQLIELTRQVFSERKYYLLQDLREASNAFDKKVGKGLIRVLYSRNKVRSQLQFAKRAEAMRNVGDQKRANKVRIPRTSCEEVLRALRQRGENWLTCGVIVNLGSVYHGLTFEALKLLYDTLMTYHNDTDTYSLRNNVILSDHAILREHGIGAGDLRSAGLLIRDDQFIDPSRNKTLAEYKSEQSIIGRTTSGRPILAGEKPKMAPAELYPVPSQWEDLEEKFSSVKTQKGKKRY